MKFSGKKMFSYFLLFAIIAMIISVVLSVTLQDSDQQQLEQQDTIDNNQLNRIEGFSFADYIDGKLGSKIKADLLQVVPIKFFIFKLNKINEIRLTNATYEYYEEKSTWINNKMVANGDAHTEIADPFKKIIPKDGIKNILPGTGMIKRIVIDKFTLTRHVNTKPVIKVLSSQTIIDLGKHKTTFRNLTLVHPKTGKRIYTHDAHWDKKAKAFVIPGKYQVTSPRGKAKGEGIMVDLNFKVKKYSSK